MSALLWRYKALRIIIAAAIAGVKTKGGSRRHPAGNRYRERNQAKGWQNRGAVWW